MEKLLTIIVPVYQTECFIRTCLSSLLRNSMARKTEVLVIDDGSFDQSGNIAEEYARQYPQIVRVIHKKNGGHGSAINVGMQLASGKYLRVVDSDDYVEPIAYERYLKKLEHFDCDLIATPFCCVQTGKEKRKREIEGAMRLPKEVVLSFREYAKVLHIRIQEWTIRTEILREHPIVLSEYSFYVDMQYILFPIPWIETFCILPDMVYLYRLGNETQSVSIKNMQRNRKQHHFVLRSLVQFYRERERYGEQKEVLSYLARGIAKMEANQVQIILSLPIGRKAKQELLFAEQELKKSCLAAYQSNQKKSLIWLRKSHYLLYPIAAIGWRIQKKEKWKKRKGRRHYDKFRKI